MSAQPGRIEPDKVDYDAGNVAHVRAAKKQAEVNDDLRRAGLAHLITTPAGRAWLYELIEFCGVFRTSFTGNSETFAREGQRNVGLKIMADIQRDHEEAYITMCREAKSRGLRGFRAKQLKDDERKQDNAE